MNEEMYMSIRLMAAVLLLSVGSVAQGATPLPAATITLRDAEQLALERDVSALQWSAQAEAMREQAVAAGQLPDPKLTVGVMSLPLDTLDRAQEPMTQLAVGVSQAFPPGATLRHQSDRAAYIGEAASAEAEERRLRVLRETRLAYLDLYLQQATLDIVVDSQAVFGDLVAITESLYRAGRNKLQDVLRAQLELSLLADRETGVRGEHDAARAVLERWTGPLSAEELRISAVELDAPPPRSSLLERLAMHPVLEAASARTAAAQAGVRVAREQYKPGWMLGVTYGDRTGNNANGSQRADFLSAVITLDVPLFTGKRQDRRLAASIRETEASQYARDDAYRELLRMLESDYPRWQSLSGRVRGFETRILPEAHGNSTAALSAYRNGVTDFTTMMRAYLMELDNQLQALRTAVERDKVNTRLMYIAGERQ